MYKVISHDIEFMLENDSKASYEADSYTLSDGRMVVWDYKSKSFIDKLDRVYTPVSENENIIGFELKE